MVVLPKQAMPPFLLLLLFLGLRSVPASDEQFVFDGFIGANLSLDGMATVTHDGLLQLTNGTSQLKGHAFYPTPLHFHGNDTTGATMNSFSTAFVIGIIAEYEDLTSHGMAFVIAKTKDLTSAMPAQYLGIAASANNGNATNHLFAVEFDTILNTEFNDISSNHVGINVNGLDSVEADNAGYYDDVTGSFNSMNFYSRKPMQVWVEFDGQTMQVNVTMAPLELARPKKPLLSTTVNLSTIIGDTAYVGFSSATGVVSTRHYVLGWSFKMNGAAPALSISSLPSLPVTVPKPRSNKILEVVLPIASTVLVFAVAAIVAFVFMRKRRMYVEQWEVELWPHRFSYKDLLHATDGFSDERLLGADGFGRVYRGVLPASNTEVAVKKMSDESRQGMKEFVSEVVSIGRLGHRNLVQLLGYCRRNRELLLVYDYMPHGSLDRHLHDQSKPTLTWGQRFRIIRDIASGLLYLHEDWKQVVLHRDIKASNVVLDAEMNGRLADFGLARLYDHGDDHLHTTHVAGTIGYLAPELGRTHMASKASDVYAFGVLVLEVACGRKPVVATSSSSSNNNNNNHHPVLVDWVLDWWRTGAITDAVDRRLRDSFVAHEASLLLTLGLLCTQQLPEARPGMRHIQRYLDGDMLLPELSTTSWQSFDITQEPNLMAAAYTGVSRMSDLSGGR